MELQRRLGGTRVCREVEEMRASAMKGSQGWFILLQGRREMLLVHTLGHRHLALQAPCGLFSSADEHSAKPISHTDPKTFSIQPSDIPCSQWICLQGVQVKLQDHTAKLCP